MPISISREKLAEIVNGKISSSKERLIFQGVEYDSRAIRGGELFLALKGEKVHGHQFLDQAFTQGAALFLVEDPKLFDTFPEPHRLVLVTDTLKAFWSLASWWRKELGTPIVAITGSVGKTTCKEATAHLLLSQAKGSYSKKSHNNHVGVPYSICQISRDHEWAVLEVGMNHAGEIDKLAELIGPNIGVITGIGAAHLEALGSLEAVADAKCELVRHVKREGAVILNADDQVLLQGFKRSESKAPANVLSFGKSAQADVRVVSVKSKGLEGIELILSVFGESLEAKSPSIGTHNAMNIAAAVLATKVLYPQMALSQLAQALGKLRSPDMRLTRHQLSGDRVLIDDSYNANPMSMRALIDIARDLQSEGKIVGLILGQMLELGADSVSLHREIGEYAAAMAPAFILAVGPFADEYVKAAVGHGVEAVFCDSPETAASEALKREFDVIAIKGSRGIALDRAVKLILDREGVR